MSKETTQLSLDELKQVFDSFDTDGNGSLSPEEVMNVLRYLGMNPSTEDIESIFISTDQDVSNTIEFDEFSQWIVDKVDITSKNDLLEIFRLIDLNNNGTISTGELQELLYGLNINVSDREIERLMQQADVNGNGLIEFDEFVKSGGLWTRIKLTVGVVRSFYIQAEFDSLARQYNQLIRLWVPWYEENLEVTLDNLQNELDAPNILELGGGTGNLSAAVLERYSQADVHIVDSSSKMIDFCQQRFASNEQIHLYEQDFMTLDFKEATFDYVISYISLHYLNDANKKQLFHNVHRWLKSDGLFSYSDIFRGINSQIHERYNEQWKRAAYEVGATDEEWNHFWDHDRRYDQHIPIMTVVDWLREIGFVDIDITWRRSLWANVIARKA
ncbi:MAG: methyltransferase domain-containing protein [Okeania sp. SIO3B5]|uniref:EF-hand domain-containing protein n=1 Tax=Okeania sp. SIO3B5 TaxID=2607811 RepID=UPI0013FE6258|nr:EF-hand domain-containing protein [Okeania sp. SIO3B5]NEO57945.1 methyltransferase domain-containing protein [Okeania sp. SIO3B5]